MIPEEAVRAAARTYWRKLEDVGHVEAMRDALEYVLPKLVAAIIVDYGATE